MNPALRKHLSRTIVAIRRLAPFYAYLATTREYVEDHEAETCWTNGPQIGVNPDFALGLTVDEFRTVIVHELEHIRKGDPWRLRIWLAGRLHNTAQVSSDDKSRWNKAADHSINNRLLAAGFAPVDGWLCDPQFANMATESIVPHMTPDPQPDQGEAAGSPSEASSRPCAGEKESGGTDEPPEGPEDNTGDSRGSDGQDADGAEAGDEGTPGDHSGDDASGTAGSGDAGEEKKPNPCGECRPSPGTAEEAERELRARKHDCRNAARYAEGCEKFDEGLRTEVEAMLQPDVDYSELLAIFMHEHAQNDEDWSNPDRDYVHYGVVIPTEDEPALGDVVFYVDTSGSMDTEAFEEVAGHVASICSDLEARLHVVYVDNAVRGYQVFDEAPSIEDFEVEGGGGTSFRPGFKFVEDKQIDPVCAIYFTDLYCSRFPEREPDYPVIWVQWGKKKIEQHQLPFGELVKRERSQA